MILDSLAVTPNQFTGGTGWHIEPRAPCKGDVCVPVAGTDGFDLVSSAQRLRMALVHDEQAGLWALGPESLGDHAHVSAEAPELVLDELDGRLFRPVLATRAEVRPRRLGTVLRLCLRPARVAGAAQ